jgi:hypothetical protein
MIRSPFVQPSAVWLDFTLPFSCPFGAPKRSKDAQSAPQCESENQPIFIGEMRDPTTSRNEAQNAANDAFFAC